MYQHLGGDQGGLDRVGPLWNSGTPKWASETRIDGLVVSFQAYSSELRDHVIAAVMAGATVRSEADRFGVVSPRR